MIRNVQHEITHNAPPPPRHKQTAELESSTPLAKGTASHQSHHEQNTQAEFAPYLHSQKRARTRGLLIPGLHQRRSGSGRREGSGIQ